MIIDISEFPKALLLTQLYKQAKPQGDSVFFQGNGYMTEFEAEIILAKVPSMDFDYVKGRSVKVNLAGDTLDMTLYHRDNGIDAGYKAINEVRIRLEMMKR